MRALIENTVEAGTNPETFWHTETLQGFLDRHADALAANPWLERLPLVLGEVQPVQQIGNWWVIDANGKCLPVRDNAVARLWTWAAHCGGRPADVAGEWHAGAFSPLALYLNTHYLALDH